MSWFGSSRDEPMANAKSGGMGGRRFPPVALVGLAGIVALAVVLAVVFLVLA